MSVIKREDVKCWVAVKAKVSNPYGKYWSASTTLAGMDINGVGETIEDAYNCLTDLIFKYAHYTEAIQKLTSWQNLIQ